MGRFRRSCTWRHAGATGLYRDPQETICGVEWAAVGRCNAHLRGCGFGHLGRSEIASLRLNQFDCHSLPPTDSTFLIAVNRSCPQPLELGHHELDQLALAIGRQEVEGMDGEANVSPAINDHDAADYIVKVLAILM